MKKFALCILLIALAFTASAMRIKQSSMYSRVQQDDDEAVDQPTAPAVVEPQQDQQDATAGNGAGDDAGDNAEQAQPEGQVQPTGQAPDGQAAGQQEPASDSDVVLDDGTDTDGNEVAGADDQPAQRSTGPVQNNENEATPSSAGVTNPDWETEQWQNTEDNDEDEDFEDMESTNAPMYGSNSQTPLVTTDGSDLSNDLSFSTPYGSRISPTDS